MAHKANCSIQICECRSTMLTKSEKSNTVPVISIALNENMAQVKVKVKVVVIKVCKGKQKNVDTKTTRL